MIAAAESVGRLAGTALTVGVDRVAAAALPLWSRARSDGLVSGSWSAARAALFGPLVSARATDAETQLVVQNLLRRELGSFVALILFQLDGFFAAVLALHAAALESGVTAAILRERILTLAESWSVGSVADTWLDSAVVRPRLHAGERLATKGETGIGALFPYLEQQTRDDDVVRENHDALHLFIARADWPGWVAEAAPPLGWRCRCRDRRISWLEANERNLTGDFPVGTEKLERFRAMGGADEGFPRDLFVAA